MTTSQQATGCQQLGRHASQSYAAGTVVPICLSHRLGTGSRCGFHHPSIARRQVSGKRCSSPPIHRVRRGSRKRGRRARQAPWCGCSLRSRSRDIINGVSDPSTRLAHNRLSQGLSARSDLWNGRATQGRKRNDRGKAGRHGCAGQEQRPVLREERSLSDRSVPLLVLRPGKRDRTHSVTIQSAADPRALPLAQTRICR